jgi:hypothetical protein
VLVFCVYLYTLDGDQKVSTSLLEPTNGGRGSNCFQLLEEQPLIYQVQQSQVHSKRPALSGRRSQRNRPAHHVRMPIISPSILSLVRPSDRRYLTA